MLILYLWHRFVCKIACLRCVSVFRIPIFRIYGSIDITDELGGGLQANHLATLASHIANMIYLWVKLMSVFRWVISLTWNCEPAETDSQDQERNGNSFCVRVSHHQQESGLHSKAWNTTMHIAFTFGSHSLGSSFLKEKAGNIRTKGIKIYT